MKKDQIITLETLCQVKKPGDKEPHIELLHLYEMLRIDKSVE